MLSSKCHGFIELNIKVSITTAILVVKTKCGDDDAVSEQTAEP